MRKKSKLIQVENAFGDGSSEVSTIYGDLVTFVMMLFILLFVLSYNKSQNEDFFTQMTKKMGGKQQEKQESMSTDALLVSQLQNFIEKETLDEYAQILVDEQKIKLIVNPPLLFDIGKAAIKPKGKRLLDGISDIMKGVENPIMIEGHTDNVPIHSNDYDSNWDLSFHRAYSVIRYLVSNKGHSPLQLSGTGYGEFRPIETNATKEGRSKNRRIEVNVIRITKTKNET